MTKVKNSELQSQLEKTNKMIQSLLDAGFEESSCQTLVSERDKLQTQMNKQELESLAYEFANKIIDKGVRNVRVNVSIDAEGNPEVKFPKSSSGNGSGGGGGKPVVIDGQQYPSAAAALRAVSQQGDASQEVLDAYEEYQKYSRSAVALLEKAKVKFTFA